MKLFDRVSRLLKSDAHGIVDQLEERSLLLKQHLRDAEIEVSDKRVRAEALEEQQRGLREQVDRIRARERVLDEDVELALAGDKQDLARFAVGRLLPVRDARRELETGIAEVAAERDRLAERLAEQEEQLVDLKSRVQARLAEARSERPTAPALERSVAEEEIQLELLRRSGVAASEGGRA